MTDLDQKTKLLNALFAHKLNWYASQLESGQGEIYLWHGMPDDLLEAGMRFALEKSCGTSFYVKHAGNEAIEKVLSDLGLEVKFPIVGAKKTQESLFEMGGGVFTLWDGVPAEILLTFTKFALERSSGAHFRIDYATPIQKEEVMAAHNGTIDRPTTRRVNEILQTTNR